MGGGLLQLVAYGASDVYFTGNPEMTFFKKIHRRHTNFAIETINIKSDESINDYFGKKVVYIIGRNGDLVSDMILKIKLPEVGLNGLWSGYCNNIGHALVKEVEIEIGGQLIDKHYSEWLDILDELNDNEEQRKILFKYKTEASLRTNNEARTVYIPLQFWFCNNHGCALPLICLQYHEVRVNITFRTMAELVKSNVDFNSPHGSIISADLQVDYIFLGVDERRRFAIARHEFLITQLQYTSKNIEDNTVEDNTAIFRLNFNHHTKYLAWIFRTNIKGAQNAVTGNNYFNYTNSLNTKQITDAILMLNGHERMEVQDEDYFRLIQQKKHFNRISDKYIYVYSFSIKPLEYQPSGNIQFSRIDNVILKTTMNGLEPCEWQVYAENYNILRIMEGKGGLAYSYDNYRTL